MITTATITELLENLGEAELISLWNEYQSEISGESQVYDFDDDFFATYFSDPAEAARAVFFGNIEQWNANYVQFNGYGNLEASNYLDNMISIYDLANHIEGNQDTYSDLLSDLEEVED